MQPMMEYPIAMQEVEMRKGPWLEEEDERLTTFVALLGERKWDSLAKTSGLKRSGKSCRLRWLNYLRPNLKHGPFSAEEEMTIIQLHKQWGNKWSRIARRLAGRTDNEIKNYWRTHLRKKTESQQEGCSPWNLEWEGQGFYDQKRFIHVENYCNRVHERPDNDLEKSNDSLHSSDSWELRRSPYETRMSDWIGSQHNYNSVACETEGSEFNSIESYHCFTPWTADNNNIWDYTDVLWDI